MSIRVRNNVARFSRPQFSLATLLIAMAWSGVAVWMNTTLRVAVIPLGTVCGLTMVSWGWPFNYASYGVELSPQPLRRLPHDGIESPWALAGDVAVGVLLTWGSSQLLRRILSSVKRHFTVDER